MYVSDLILSMLLLKSYTMTCFKQVMVGIVITALLSSSVVGAKNVSLDKNARLFYTCKIWGYLKYFHPAVNGCDRNIDSILIALIPEIEAASNDSSFNASLLKMFAFAGPMPIATTAPPVLADSEKINLDLRWHDDASLGLAIRVLLDSVRINFRPKESCYYIQKSGAPFYIAMERNYSMDTAMTEPYRLLTFFRAWNIYNNFSPYKFVLDRSWDSVLMELIPLVSAANTPLDFHLALLRFQAAEQDGHAFTTSDFLSAHFGEKYLPVVFSYVEGKTIVTKVFHGITGIKTGDVVTKVDGTLTENIRDSLRKYTQGGNEAIIQRNLSINLGRGVGLTAALELDDGTGIRSIMIDRTSDYSEVVDSLTHSTIDGFPYKRLNANVGYVNYGILHNIDVDQIVSNLWDTKAMIIDCRNYPTNDFPFRAFCKKLLPDKTEFVLQAFPQTNSPCTQKFSSSYIGVWNGFSYEGKVLLLVNEVTQSAAEDATMAFSVYPDVITIGSHTAGADGEEIGVNYPTGITMKYSGFGVYYPDGTQTQRVGVKVDKIVTPTIAGIRAGKDEVLEAALALVAKDGTKTFTKKDPISLQPNPSSGIIAVHSQTEEINHITVTNIVGQKIMEMAQPAVSDFIIDLSKYSSGIYIIKLSSAHLVTSRMIVRQ